MHTLAQRRRSKFGRRWFNLVVFVAWFVVSNGAAQDLKVDSDDHLEIVKKLVQGEYSGRGADSCLGCHDEDEVFPTLELFHSVHGHPHLAGSPFQQDPPHAYPAGLQCEACHGPAGDHAKKFLGEGEIREAMLNFGARGNVAKDLQNQMCLACHADYERTHWQNSAHELGQIACADCHKIHSQTDSVRARLTHNEVCTTCHTEVATAMLNRSSHPMRENHLICRDCHDPHGGNVDAKGLLHKQSTNEMCYECHQEKAGPFIWDHPPVVEDCGICHLPHGSNQPALLVRRAPQLCQGCHSSVGHRSLRMDPNRQPTDPGAEFQFLNACLNCHAQVHGSNHPSGNLFRR